jgi:hypothetical protein
MTKLQNTLAGRITVLALFAASLACGVSASTANISDAYLARDPEGTDPTTVFLPDEPFYLIVELANAPDDTVVKAVWVAVDVDDVDFDTVIDEAELTTSSGQLTFDLSNDDLWPAGNYKVDVYVNDNVAETVEFSVEEAG